MEQSIFYKSVFLLLLTVISGGPAFSQDANAALDHMQWFPSGSYAGFLHIDRSHLDEDARLLLSTILSDVDIISLKGTDSDYLYMTVGLAQDLDRQRERRLSRGRSGKETGGFWFFFDEIIVLEHPALDAIIRNGMEQGQCIKEKPVYKLPVFQYKVPDHESLWFARISPVAIVLSNDKNKLVASLRAGTGRAESVLDDPHLQDMQAVLPGSALWFVAPERATLLKDYDYAVLQGESDEKLAKKMAEIEERPEYLILSFRLGDQLSMTAEAIFEGEETANRQRGSQGEWAYDFIPFSKEDVLEQIDENDGRILKTTLVFNYEQILKRSSSKQ